MSRYALSPAILIALLAGGCSDKPAAQPEEVDAAAPAAQEQQQPAESTAAPGQTTLGRALDQTTQKVVEMAAKLSAAAAACGQASGTETDTAAAKSREAMVERGYSVADHDRIYDAAFKSTEDEYAQMSAAEQKQSCDELEQFGAAMKEMADKMQSQQQ